MTNNDEVYLDKIALGGMIVEKELNLISQFNRLISEIDRGIIDIERLREYPLYSLCWVNLSELYDFLKNDYIERLKDKEDKEFLIKTLEKYQNMTKDLVFKDLKRAKDIVLKIMSLSKFHDIFRKIDNVAGLDKIDKRYKF